MQICDLPVMYYYLDSIKRNLRDSFHYVFPFVSLHNTSLLITLPLLSGLAPLGWEVVNPVMIYFNALS